jgi:hypothetical protein
LQRRRVAEHRAGDKEGAIMKAVSRRRALPLLGAAASGVAGGATADTGSGVQGIIDGAFILEEWHIDDNVYRPPQVDGRAVFLNGAVVVVMINKAHEEKQFTVALLGAYTLSAELFSYRYDNASIFIQTGSAIEVSHRPPWEGMRDFDLTKEGDALRLRSRSSEHAEFLVNAEGQKYWEGGKLVRVWRRATA